MRHFSGKVCGGRQQTGKVAHSHDRITFEGGEIPTKKQVEGRAMRLAQQFAAERPDAPPDRLEILHVEPEELEDVLAPTVDVRARKLIQADQLRPRH